MTLHYIYFDLNNLKSIKKAERKKSLYENKGYILLAEFLNSIEGKATLTYGER